ncbi:MAG: Glycogen synthase [Chlamydiae bacterium]|nr:Glycogen synthase [Chlamydiota bacterium]
MHIVHFASELSPIAKVGGLADVTAGLLKALTRGGERAEVILPFYDQIDRSKLKNLHVVCEELSESKSAVWAAEMDGIQLLLIDPQNNYFKRGVIYGEKDDDQRFIHFTNAAMEYLLRGDSHPDILHLHDWLTGLAAPLYHEKYKSLGLKLGGIMTTIHNMKYQGVCKPELLSEIGLSPTPLLKRDKLQDSTKPDKLNLLKGALLYSDSLTTVSPTYAEEIKGEEGFSLGTILQQREERLIGILNGIDTEYWDPETDPLLEKNYPAHFTSLDAIQSAKRANRKALSKRLKLKESSAPLFTCITRLVQQKGPEMIRFGLEYTLKRGGQFVLLASTPEKEVKKAFHDLAHTYRDNPNVHLHFIFDEELAHLTYAAADCILLPSLFEPCGLTQMIALRYGTIPIVHKVGGLRDTIFDIDDEEHPSDQKNGYTFDSPTNESLRQALDRGLDHHQNDPKKWERMVKNGLSRDWSWKVPAQQYLKIYKDYAG